MRSTCKIALTLTALAVFLTSAGTAQAAFGMTGRWGNSDTRSKHSDRNVELVIENPWGLRTASVSR